MLLPGTKMQVPRIDGENAKNALGLVFSSGGLVLSQVSSLTGLEEHTVQNWVKRRFLPPPVNKKYTADQFCRIALINMMKDSLTLAEISKLLETVNGVPDDESDDIIPEKELYCLFIGMISKNDEKSKDDYLESELEDRFDGEKERSAVSKGLEVIAAAYRAGEYKKKVAELVMKMGLQTP